MVIGFVGNQFVVFFYKDLGYGLCIFNDLFCVCFEVGLQCFVESYCFGGNDVFKWAVLYVREDFVVKDS